MFWRTLVLQLHPEGPLKRWVSYHNSTWSHNTEDLDLNILYRIFKYVYNPSLY